MGPSLTKVIANHIVVFLIRMIQADREQFTIILILY